MTENFAPNILCILIGTASLRQFQLVCISCFGEKSPIYNVMRHEAETPGRVAQLLRCLATDACLTADPGVGSSIPARSHTFVEIDHEIISTVILLPSTDSFKKGCCQLQTKVCARMTG